MTVAIFPFIFSQWTYRGVIFAPLYRLLRYLSNKCSYHRQILRFFGQFSLAHTNQRNPPTMKLSLYFYNALDIMSRLQSYCCHPCKNDDFRSTFWPKKMETMAQVLGAPPTCMAPSIFGCGEGLQFNGPE